MTDQLVISALGEDKPGIVNALSKSILDAGGNIAESHMMVLGGEFSLMVLVNAASSKLADIEAAIQDVKQQWQLTLIAKRTRSKFQEKEGLPYKISIVAMDHPGIVHQVTDFLAQHQINVEELQTDSYAAAHTGTPMFSMDISVALPSSTNLAEFRKNFTAFCDELNLDVTFEARK